MTTDKAMVTAAVMAMNDVLADQGILNNVSAYTVDALARAALSSLTLERGEAEPVAVKPLEWDANMVAKTPFGNYCIWNNAGYRTPKQYSLGRPGLPLTTVLSHDADEYFDTIEQAKAAAQYDYETRILSTLSKRDDPVAALVVDHTGCEHMSRDIAQIDRIAADCGERPTYLYSTLSKRGEAEPVAVKPLEWEGGPHEFSAVTIIGTYCVDRSHGKARFYAPDRSSYQWLDTCDDAKAAAQYDYETRILSTLSKRGEAEETPAKMQSGAILELLDHPAPAHQMLGWQTRRPQDFLDKYPDASEYVAHIHETEREARLAGVPTRDMVNGDFPPERLAAVIIRPVYAYDAPEPAHHKPLLTCQCANSKTDPCIVCGKGKTLVTAEWISRMALLEDGHDATTGSPAPVSRAAGGNVLNDMLLARAPNHRWTLATLLKEAGVEKHADRLAYMKAALEAAQGTPPPSPKTAAVSTPSPEGRL